MAQQRQCTVQTNVGRVGELKGVVARREEKREPWRLTRLCVESQLMGETIDQNHNHEPLTRRSIVNPTIASAQSSGHFGDPVLCRWMCGRAIPPLVAI